MIKSIKNFFSNLISTKYKVVDYDEVLNSLFTDIDITTKFYDKVVIHIITTQFDPDIAMLMYQFKNYKLSNLELQVVMFKIGALCQMFLEQPKIALEEALKLGEDVFSSEDLININNTLIKVTKTANVKLIEDYKKFKSDKIPKKILTADEKANFLIEEYIKSKYK